MLRIRIEAGRGKL